MGWAPLTDRKRPLLLLAIMTVVALIIGGSAIGILYETGFEQRRVALVQTARSQARLMEAVARFDRRHTRYARGARAATLRQIRDARERFEGLGATGEFTLAKREGDQIVFLMRHRHDDLDQPKPVSFGSALAEPMRRALSGRSGSVVGPDYRGVTVLAAHEPVKVLGLGIVAKVDLSEIRAPFLQAAGVVVGVSVLVIVLGTIVFFRVSNPMLRRLEQSEARYRELVEAIPHGVLETDADGEVVFCNSEECRIRGQRASDLVGKTIFDLFGTRSERDGARAFFNALRADRSTAEPYFTTVRQPGGGERQVQIDWSYKRSPEGSVTGGVAVTTDITSLRRAEAALRQSEERFRAAIDQAGDAIYLQRLDGRFVEVNRRACEALGYSRDELLALSAPEISTEIAPERFAATVAGMERGRPITVEAHHRRKDGSVFPVEIRAVLIEIDEQAQVLSLVRDTTERRRAEEALREANRRKDEFLAMLAHELRNPLAPLLHASQLVQRPESGERSVQRALQIIERQVRHMARLIEDLLDISRITRGKIELHPRLVELSTVVEEVVQSMRPAMDRAGHELTVATPPGPPLLLWADADRLAQVLTNLLSNAAKYTDDGGRIRLCIEVEEDRVLIVVQDNGIGIPPDVAPQIFDLFSQVDSSASRSRGGLGLGLALARRLVELHGGTIEVHSDGPGQGSAFHVRLPLATAEQAAGAGPGHDQQPPPPLPARRILLVEDNLEAAEMLRTLLTLAGHEVCLEADGPAALEAARVFQPDVVLLDIGLPGMDGYEVARRLRALPGQRRSLLVAITGLGQEADRRRSRNAGIDHHLTKPVDSSYLQDLLSREPERGPVIDSVAAKN